MNARGLYLACCAPLLCAGVQFSTDRGNWEFGRYPLGQAFSQPPADIRERRDCLDERNPLSCELLLRDGVWYAFEGGRLVRKTILLPSRNVPHWIVPSDNLKACKTRLERLMKAEFRFFKDDYGLVFLETRDMIVSPRGQPYNLIVVFRHGRMAEIIQTPLPHEDS